MVVAAHLQGLQQRRLPVKPPTANEGHPALDAHPRDLPFVGHRDRHLEFGRGGERDHWRRVGAGGGSHGRVGCSARARQNRAVGDKRHQTQTAQTVAQVPLVLHRQHVLPQRCGVQRPGHQTAPHQLGHLLAQNGGRPAPFNASPPRRQRTREARFHVSAGVDPHRGALQHVLVRLVDLELPSFGAGPAPALHALIGAHRFRSARKRAAQEIGDGDRAHFRGVGLSGDPGYACGHVDVHARWGRERVALGSVHGQRELPPKVPRRLQIVIRSVARSIDALQGVHELFFGPTNTSFA
mmetsp:Transcript_7262/g.14878  ORF Transcript_7262/g.14878 Transcript_7262/m.14878 type:complete len:296 (-) Transcript_7262:48-935(-)